MAFFLIFMWWFLLIFGAFSKENHRLDASHSHPIFKEIQNQNFDRLVPKTTLSVENSHFMAWHNSIHSFRSTRPSLYNTYTKSACHRSRIFHELRYCGGNMNKWWVTVILSNSCTIEWCLQAHVVEHCLI